MILAILCLCLAQPPQEQPDAGQLLPRPLRPKPVQPAPIIVPGPVAPVIIPAPPEQPKGWQDWALALGVAMVPAVAIVVAAFVAGLFKVWINRRG